VGTQREQFLGWTPAPNTGEAPSFQLHRIAFLLNALTC